MFKEWIKEWDAKYKGYDLVFPHHPFCRCHINKVVQGFKLDCYGEDFNFNDSICNECSDREDCFARKYLHRPNYWKKRIQK